MKQNRCDVGIKQFKTIRKEKLLNFWDKRWHKAQLRHFSMMTSGGVAGYPSDKQRATVAETKAVPGDLP